MLSEQDRLRQLFDAQQMAPCWLVQGAPVQARSFADQLACYILASPLNGHGMKADLVGRHIKNGSFGNSMVIRKNEDASEISVDQLVPVFDFLHKSPLIPGFRVLIIDSIDQMNRFGVNSLLKSLEEPPQKTYIFLICRQLASVLPTIRSRCQSVHVDENMSIQPILYQKEASELVQCAYRSDFTQAQRLCERVCNGDKAQYDVLAMALFDTLYHNVIDSKNGNEAELWLLLTRFWEESKTTHLDRQHAFMIILTSIENPSALKDTVI